MIAEAIALLITLIPQSCANAGNNKSGNQS